MNDSILKQWEKETKEFKTLNDWFEYFDEPFVDCDALELFEELRYLISNQNDISTRIKGKGSGVTRQQAETYYELIVGKSLQQLFDKDKDGLKYKIKYEEPYYNKGPKPDWTVIDGQDRFVLELVTKHKSDHDLVLDSIIALISKKLEYPKIHYTQFPPILSSQECKFSRYSLKCNILNLYVSGLIDRIKQARLLSQDSGKDICIDGLSIDFNVKGGKTRSVGSIPHRYMLSIAEKARKLDAIAEKHPVIIGVMSTKHLRAAGMNLPDMTKMLYGEICECIPEQLNLRLEDYRTIECSIPSLRKVAGLMFYNLKYSSDAVSIQSCNYFKNPYYGKDYPKVLESYLQRVSKKQDFGESIK